MNGIGRRGFAAGMILAAVAAAARAAENQAQAPIPKAWRGRRAEFRARAAQQSGAVVFLGDSITQGLGKLAPHLFPGLNIANRGIIGDTSFGLKLRLAEDVLSLNPRAVVILIGTNDLTGGAAPQAIAGNIRRIVSAINSAQPQCPVILCLVMPRAASSGVGPEKIQALNALIRAAARHSRNTSICDTFRIFAGGNGEPSLKEFPDGLHPNTAGYAKWAAALRPLLARRGIS